MLDFSLFTYIDVDATGKGYVDFKDGSTVTVNGNAALATTLAMIEEGMGISFKTNNAKEAVGITAVALEGKTYANATLLNDLVSKYPGITVSGQGTTKTVVTGAVTVTVKDVTITNVKIDGNLTINNTATGFTSKSNHITGTVDVNGANASFNTEIDGKVTVNAKGAAFSNVTMKGALEIKAAAEEVVVSGTTKVTGTITVAPGARIDASKATDEDVKAAAEAADEVADELEDAADQAKAEALEEAEEAVEAAEEAFGEVQANISAVKALSNTAAILALQTDVEKAIDALNDAIDAAEEAIEAAEDLGVDVADLEARVEAITDETAPEIDDVDFSYDEDKKELTITVKASDDLIGLYELEIDHSGDQNEFNVYAFEKHPLFDDSEIVKNNVTVEYKAGTWEIVIKDAYLTASNLNGEVKFYMVIRDFMKKESGSMNEVTEDMTYEFTIPAEEAGE